MLPGLTEEQNEVLKRMHMEAMDSLELIKKMVRKENLYSDKLALMTLTQAQTYLELGDFERDPRFPK